MRVCTEKLLPCILASMKIYAVINTNLQQNQTSIKQIDKLKPLAKKKSSKVENKTNIRESSIGGVSNKRFGLCLQWKQYKIREGVQSIVLKYWWVCIGKNKLKDQRLKDDLLSGVYSDCGRWRKIILDDVYSKELCSKL